MSDSDSPTNKRIKEVVSSDLSTRYDEGCIQQLLNVVTYLDPRYKNLPFLNESEKGMVMDHVSVVEDRDVEERPSEEAENETLPPRKKKKFYFRKILQESH